MKFVRKILPELVIFPLITLFYFITRLFHLMSLPIFTDEAIYSRWSQIAKLDASWRFISLTDGKQPSFVWADMILMKFVHDPLLSGRLVSVFAGFITVIGMYFLTNEIFKNNEKGKNTSRIIALIASALVVIYPFSLVYDKMAIYDTLVATFLVWSLYFQILLIRKLRFDIAMITGVVLGGAILTKSSGFLSIYLTPFLLVLIDFRHKYLKKRILRFALLALISTVIAYALYQILRLSPFYHIIDEKNSVFVYPVSVWLHFPISEKIGNFISNFNGLWSWFLSYFTIPFTVLIVVAFFVSFRFLKEKTLLFLWFLLPFTALAIFGRTIYPRYLLFMSMSLIPLVAFSIYHLFERYRNVFVRAILLIVILLLPLYSDYYILFNFPKAPIPKTELDQYINGWPSGGGVRESTAFFKNQAKLGKIFIATQGTFGLMPASYELYLVSNPNVKIKGYWPTNEQIPSDLLKEAKSEPTYVVFYQPCSNCSFPGAAPSTWPLTLISTYKKGVGQDYLSVYRVNPL